MASPSSTSDTKPLKLRAACNSCFSAKVRCDGNKECCVRCAERQLECTYSISRVGKVVGKRRKRPFPGAPVNSTYQNPWAINLSLGNLPSPTETNVSSDSRSHNCFDSNWSSLISYDDQDSLDFGDCEDQSYFLTYSSGADTTMSTDLPRHLDSGLPTPTFTTPTRQFLSPAELETRPSSFRPSSESTPLNFVQPGLPASISKPLEFQNDDDETTCIKLLAHVKKHVSSQQESSEGPLVLLQKINAAVQRLLRSKNVRSEYTCQLLLSSIAQHLTILVERLCQQNLKGSRVPRRQSSLDSNQSGHTSDSGFFSPTRGPGAPLDPQETVQMVVKETMSVCFSIGNLLKQKPYNGFQTLGKHEKLHVELDQRLRKALAASE